MNERIKSIFQPKRNKVVTNRNKYLLQLQNNSSTPTRNVQFGVDYSKQKPKSVSESSTKQQRVASKKLINLTPSAQTLSASTASLPNSRISPSRYEISTKLQLQKSPELPRKQLNIQTINTRKTQSRKENISVSPTSPVLQYKREHEPISEVINFPAKIEPNTNQNHGDTQDYVATKRNQPPRTISIQASAKSPIKVLLSPQSEPDTTFSNLNIQTLKNRSSPKYEPIEMNSNESNKSSHSKPTHSQLYPHDNKIDTSHVRLRRSPRKLVNQPSSVASVQAIDPSLVSVSQRAKSIMQNKTATKSILVNKHSNTENDRQIDFLKEAVNDNQEPNEPIMSLKDRIKCYRDSTVISTSTANDINQHKTVIDPSEKPKSIKSIKNRFKTQPISLDDIVRANSLFLDQADTASTIASPTLSTNSRETLVDLSDDINSPIKKSFSILKSKRDLMDEASRSSVITKSFDENDELALSSINVKQLAKQNYETTDNRPKNNAISRKIAFKNKTSSEDMEEIPIYKVYGKRSHTTQPLTKLDLEEADMNNNGKSISIEDRIKNMKESGETSWLSRHKKTNPNNQASDRRPISLYNIQKDLENNQDKWKNRVESKDVHEFTYKNKMRNSLRQQKNRISYHGNASSTILDDQPALCTVERYKNGAELAASYSPQPFILSSSVNIKTLEPETVPPVESSVQSKTQSKQSSVISNTKSDVQTNVVPVPEMSEESLKTFFPDINLLDSPQLDDNDELNKPTTDDFDDIFLSTQDHEFETDLMVHKRAINPRRQKYRTNSSKNPIKALSDHPDIKSSYTEQTSILQRPSSIHKPDSVIIPTQPVFAEEALAGLASKEDFSRIKLSKRRSSQEVLGDLKISPYKPTMLILVKGRKRVQMRLVEPSPKSINDGDCYILLKTKQVFVWLGECSNIIERNKANDLVSWIIKSKDLHYSGSKDRPIVIDHLSKSVNKTEEKQFWELLNSDSPETQPIGNENEDEQFENLIQCTNLVYEVVGNKLLPMKDYWCKRLTYEMLNEQKVFILDFGTELYMWKGKKSSAADNLYGLDFLKQLYYMGYDYTGAPINPMAPLAVEFDHQMAKGNLRPEWCIVGRVPQNCETSLFKEKFSNWPDPNRLMGALGNQSAMKGDNFKKSLDEPTDTDLVPIDLSKYFPNHSGASAALNQSQNSNQPPSTHLVIEGRSVGRGGTWSVIEDGILREFTVTTTKLRVWRIHMLKQLQEITEPNKIGQFHSEEAYILHWSFELKTLGRYNRSGRSGFQSGAYFFWQGHGTSVTEKAASALLTIEIQREQQDSTELASAAQIRVVENEEPPAFCRLFDGKMVVHRNKMLHKSNTRSRLFILRGEMKQEAHFVEVECNVESLRSRGIFLLISNTGSRSKVDGIYLWFSKCATESMRQAAKYSIQKLLKLCPVELFGSNPPTSVTEMCQTDPVQLKDFINLIGGEQHGNKGFPFVDISQNCKLEPIKGWLASAITGEFELCELKYSLQSDQDALDNNYTSYNIRSNDGAGKDSNIAAFPFTQNMLYSVRQPSLFIIWTPRKIFLWQGWWQKQLNEEKERKTSDSSNQSDVSHGESETTDDSNWSLPQNRIAAEKLAALKTIDNFIGKNNSYSGSIVYAGLEPPEFQQLFPFWEISEEARVANLKKSYKDGQQDSIKAVLDYYLSATYSIERLRAVPLPESVIPWKREAYLKESDFEALFKMSKTDFYSLQSWKQKDLKIKSNFY